MKIFSVCFSIVLLALAGCSNESVTLFDGKIAYSKTERGDFAVPVALRTAPTGSTRTAASLDAVLGTARSELGLYTGNPELWEFASIHSHSTQNSEIAYQVQFRKDWDGWIMIMVAADGTVLGRPVLR